MLNGRRIVRRCIGKKVDILGFNFKWNKVAIFWYISCNRIKYVVASESLSKQTKCLHMKVKFRAF